MHMETMSDKVAWQASHKKISYIRNGAGQLLEQEMTAHFSILAWKTSWTEEPGGPQAMGLHRVRHA